MKDNLPGILNLLIFIMIVIGLSYGIYTEAKPYVDAKKIVDLKNDKRTVVEKPKSVIIYDARKVIIKY